MARRLSAGFVVHRHQHPEGRAPRLAIALDNPALLAKMIQPGLLPGSYKVTFPDGGVETAYEGDIIYAREKRYDESKALWVTVLFRAYGQRVLRDALRRAVDKTTLSAFVKTPLRAAVNRASTAGGRFVPDAADSVAFGGKGGENRAGPFGPANRFASAVLERP